MSLWNLLSRNETSIFIAGNANNMPQSVKESFIKILCTEGRLSNEQAENIIDKMEVEGRYQTETWA